MALLKPSELRRYDALEDDAAPPAPFAGMVATVPSVCIVGRNGVDLASLLPNIEPDRDYHLPCRADWSLHEMLEFLLQRTGPARVWLTSWGITQGPLDHVLQLQRSGRITELSVLFDSRVKLQCPQAFQLAMAGKARVKLTKNHSKLIVIRNEQWGITVVSSANLTRNVRIEYYLVCTAPAVAEFNSQWIDLELDDAQPFDPE